MDYSQVYSRFIKFAVAIICSIGFVNAQGFRKVRVSWDIMREPIVAGYRVYTENKTQGVTRVDEIPGRTMNEWLVRNLPPQCEYKMWITAHDGDLEESDPSDDINFYLGLDSFEDQDLDIPAPENFIAIFTDQDTLQFSWDAVGNGKYKFVRTEVYSKTSVQVFDTTLYDTTITVDLPNTFNRKYVFYVCAYHDVYQEGYDSVKIGVEYIDGSVYITREKKDPPALPILIK